MYTWLVDHRTQLATVVSRAGSIVELSDYVWVIKVKLQCTNNWQNCVWQLCLARYWGSFALPQFINRKYPHCFHAKSATICRHQKTLVGICFSIMTANWFVMSLFEFDIKFCTYFLYKDENKDTSFWKLEKRTVKCRTLSSTFRAGSWSRNRTFSVVSDIDSLVSVSMTVERI